jgi:prepilin peptidase CpaA
MMDLFGANTNMSSILTIATEAIILSLGVIDDLRSRKFHNSLFLFSCAIALIIVLTTQGFAGLYLSVFGFGAGIIVFLPLVLMGMVGAGDMKLVAAFGIIAGWNAVLTVTLYSLAWGAALGLVKSILSGHLKILLRNIVSVLSLQPREALQLQKIPYAVALFVGWLSYLVVDYTASKQGPL